MHINLYEMILLALGALFFLILCGALVFFVIKDKPFKRLLWFFPISIVMMGYSGIQEIRVKDNMLEIKKYTEELEEDPTNTEAREKLEEAVHDAEPRATSLDVQSSISKAYLLLDQPDKAIDYANIAIQTREKELGMDGQEQADGGSDDSELESLSSIITLATLQKELDQDSPIDTVEIRRQIMAVPSIDDGTKKYFDRRYLKK